MLKNSSCSSSLSLNFSTHSWQKSGKYIRQHLLPLLWIHGAVLPPLLLSPPCCHLFQTFPEQWTCNIFSQQQKLWSEVQLLEVKTHIFQIWLFISYQFMFNIQSSKVAEPTSFRHQLDHFRVEDLFTGPLALQTAPHVRVKKYNLNSGESGAYTKCQFTSWYLFLVWGLF